MQENDCTFLNIFKTPDATQDQISKAGEMFVLMLYKGKDTCMSLDTFRYMSMMKISQKKVNSSLGAFQLETPPPTFAAFKYHTHVPILINIKYFREESKPQSKWI